MEKAKIGLILLLLVGCLVNACKQSDVELKEAVLTLPTEPYSYIFSQNSNIPTLGRVLFYDSRLSLNNSISCASCHKQAMAFADNVAFSEGFEGKKTFRNSMPIQNLAGGGGFEPTDDLINGGGDFNQGPPSLFWDGREKLLQAMVLRPITNHVEMGITDIAALSEKLGRIEDYQKLFTKAYGDPVVTEQRISDALSQFLTNIVSNNSKFDQSQQSTNVKLTGLELAGHDLFFGKYNCNNCHQTQALNGYQMGGGFVDIGLDPTTDVGLGDVSGQPSDQRKFKIPTLRNVALTAPYMHDGRFTTLDEVLDHYSDNIQDDPNLDSRLRGLNNAPLKMDIPYSDRQSIIAFLNSLTDYQMITDPKFSNPFQVK